MAAIIQDITVFTDTDYEMTVTVYTDIAQTQTENISGNSYAGRIKGKFSDTEDLVLFTPTITDAPNGKLLLFIPEADVALLVPVECDEDSKRYVEVGIYRITKTRLSDGVELPFMEGKVYKDKF